MNTGQGMFAEQMANGPAQGSGPLFGDLMQPLQWGTDEVQVKDPNVSFKKPCQGPCPPQGLSPRQGPSFLVTAS